MMRRTRSYCCLIAGILGLLGIVVSADAQRLDGETNLFAGATRLERPESVARSETGEQVAVCDPVANRIAVVDYQGRPLWALGDQVDLGHPLASVFVGDNELLFTRSADGLILRASRERLSAFDTVADLSTVIGPERRLSQFVANGTDGWIGLDQKKGEVLQFDRAWQLKGILIPHGSGQGKVLVPTAILSLDDKRLVVTDAKNYPGQVFSVDGRFLFYLGWSAPGDQRGWEAVAAATDNRGRIWVADETNSVFRLFDTAGGETGRVQFPHPLFRAVAMCPTIDERMCVIEETGRAFYYTIE